MRHLVPPPPCVPTLIIGLGPARAFKTLAALAGELQRLRAGADLELRPIVASHAGGETFPGFAVWIGEAYAATIAVQGAPIREVLDALAHAAAAPAEAGA